MADTNKVRFGLKNVHTVPLTIKDGEYTFGVPEPYPGAVSINIDPEGETTPFYADDIVYHQSTSNNGYSGDLEMAYLTDNFQTKYLNYIVDSNGNIVELADGDNAPFGLMFEFDGDQNAVKHFLYHCVATRPTIEGNTKEETKEPQTSSIPFSATPIQVGDKKIVKTQAKKGDKNYDDFYTKAPTLPTFTVEGA